MEGRWDELQIGEHAMFDYAKFQRVALALVGAIIFTTVSVGAAVGPARQVETTPVQTAAANAIGSLA